MQRTAGQGISTACRPPCNQTAPWCWCRSRPWPAWRSCCTCRSKWPTCAGSYRGRSRRSGGSRSAAWGASRRLPPNSCSCKQICCIRPEKLDNGHTLSTCPCTGPDPRKIRSGRDTACSRPPRRPRRTSPGPSSSAVHYSAVVWRTSVRVRALSAVALPVGRPA